MALSISGMAMPKVPPISSYRLRANTSYGTFRLNLQLCLLHDEAALLVISMPNLTIVRFESARVRLTMACVAGHGMPDPVKFPYSGQRC